MQADEVRAAIEKTGSINKAAKVLGKSHTALQWWIARNGYQVIKTATLKPITPAKELKS